MQSDYQKRKSALRRMVAEHGVHGLLRDVSDVCKDMALAELNTRQCNTWFNRASELKGISERIEGEGR